MPVKTFNINNAIMSLKHMKYASVKQKLLTAYPVHLKQELKMVRQFQLILHTLPKHVRSVYTSLVLYLIYRR